MEKRELGIGAEEEEREPATKSVMIVADPEAIQKEQKQTKEAYTLVEKENEMFTLYYKGLNILPASEFDTFYN